MFTITIKDFNKNIFEFNEMIQDFMIKIIGEELSLDNRKRIKSYKKKLIEVGFSKKQADLLTKGQSCFLKYDQFTFRITTNYNVVKTIGYAIQKKETSDKYIIQKSEQVYNNL